MLLFIYYICKLFIYLSDVFYLKDQVIICIEKGKLSQMLNKSVVSILNALGTKLNNKKTTSINLLNNTRVRHKQTVY